MNILNPFKAKKFNRFENHFVSEHKSYDLTNMIFLHSGVDTLKQLFQCNLKSSVLDAIFYHYETFKTDLFHFDGYDFLISKGSKKSGYQYILKNLDAGFVVLLKNFRIEGDQNGSHLKIEVTPQKIFSTSPADLSAEIRDLAKVFATNVLEKAVAAHVCVDMKGFDVPDDFQYRLKTTSSRKFRANGISEAVFDLNEISTVYGDRETYTFGSSGALQMSLYRKDKEVKKHDTEGFWHSVWSKVGSVEDCFTPAFMPGDVVERLEFRFHHSVIADFERHLQTRYKNPSFSLRNYEQLHEHLAGLWCYALNNFRLMDDKGYVDPVWQKLAEDIKFFHESPAFIYKREYKKPSSDVNHRHVAHWLGNFIKIHARKNSLPRYVTNLIMKQGLESDLCSYFRLLEFGEMQDLPEVLHAFVHQRMLTHKLNGVGSPFNRFDRAA